MKIQNKKDHTIYYNLENFFQKQLTMKQIKIARLYSILAAVLIYIELRFYIIIYEIKKKCTKNHDF